MSSESIGTSILYAWDLTPLPGRNDMSGGIDPNGLDEGDDVALVDAFGNLVYDSEKDSFKEFFDIVETVFNAPSIFEDPDHLTVLPYGDKDIFAHDGSIVAFSRDALLCETGSESVYSLKDARGLFGSYRLYKPDDRPWAVDEYVYGPDGQLFRSSRVYLESTRGSEFAHAVTMWHSEDMKFVVDDSDVYSWDTGNYCSSDQESQYVDSAGGGIRRIHHRSVTLEDRKHYFDSIDDHFLAHRFRLDDKKHGVCVDDRCYYPFFVGKGDAAMRMLGLAEMPSMLGLAPADVKILVGTADELIDAAGRYFGDATRFKVEQSFYSRFASGCYFHEGLALFVRMDDPATGDSVKHELAHAIYRSSEMLKRWFPHFFLRYAAKALEIAGVAQGKDYDLLMDVMGGRRDMMSCAFELSALRDKYKLDEYFITIDEPEEFFARLFDKIRPWRVHGSQYYSKFYDALDAFAADGDANAFFRVLNDRYKLFDPSAMVEIS